MKLTSIVISLMAPFSFASAATTWKITYNNKYDYKDTPLSAITCHETLSNLGFNGSFKNLTNWPNIGGSKVVADSKSPKCGSCWKLIFDPERLPINVIALDTADKDFVISVEAMNTLTNGHATQYVTIDASTAVEVNRAYCGLPA